MKITIAGVALGLLSTPSHAALSGFYDSAEQITAILESPDVADALRQMPIKSLEHEGVREDGTIGWEIEAEGCDLTVRLRPVPPAGIGKTTYNVEVTGACE